MTIHLPEELESGILAAVHNGQFASLDDAMTKAAALLLERLTQQQANVPTAAEKPTTKTQPIWEEIQELTADVPDEEWAKLPPDLAEQHDHYIYGTPKRPPSP
jgi:Arc/MetJ-type ribon-helix-helix transcriptional regulator